MNPDFIRLGYRLDTGDPYLEPADKFIRNNSRTQGATGSGKTTLLAARIVQDLLFRDVALIIFDGAQWPFFYHFVHALAKAAGREVRVLFDNDRYLSHKLDPFEQFRRLGVLPNELAGFLFNCASIPSSKVYGEGWYALANLAGAREAADAVLRLRIPVTLPALVEKMKAVGRNFRDSEQIHYSLKVAASHSALASIDDGTSSDFVRWSEVEKKKALRGIVWVLFSVSAVYR